jgi:dihydropteroate synthase
MLTIEDKKKQVAEMSARLGFDGLNDSRLLLQKENELRNLKENYELTMDNLRKKKQ